MSDILSAIKARGYWGLQIRPTSFDGRRIPNISELFQLTSRSSVQLRGWDFPHIDMRNEPRIGVDWVEQDIDWGEHKEAWRMYQSGQFVYYGAYGLDWAEDTTGWVPAPPVPPQGKLLSTGDVVCRYAEFFEFAAALTLSPAGAGEMYVSVLATSLSGRELWMTTPGQLWVWERPKATVPEFEQHAVFARDELVSRTRHIGNTWAQELFRRFGWDPPDEFMEVIRAEFR